MTRLEPRSTGEPTGHGGGDCGMGKAIAELLATEGFDVGITFPPTRRAHVTHHLVGQTAADGTPAPRRGGGCRSDRIRQPA